MSEASEGTGRRMPDDGPITVSTRDDGELQVRLAEWLSGRVGGPAELTCFERPQGNGMSSDTVLFDAAWSAGGGEAGSFVARLAPSGDAFPVFPTYDIEAQAKVMRLVGERTGVPVPTVRWFEPSADHLGTPFLVMKRVEGRVPPDVMPYPMGSWVSEASEAERDAMQAASVGVLAGIHGLEAAPGELDFVDAGGPGATALRRHVDGERAYHAWVCEGLETPLLDRAFAWLEEHWPEAADAAPPVLNWGDARIGNVIYRDFEPVGVLDWEMASVGPREIDLGWMIFLHRFFQDMAEDFGMPGLPTFFERDTVAETYARLSGHEPRDLDWFITYAAARHGVIMTRVMGRQVHFGEREAPDDPEEFVMHRRSLERLLDGTYYS
jgi:aminoglycoside phosphotransferase (APT) family kinase protein